MFLADSKDIEFPRNGCREDGSKFYLATDKDGREVLRYDIEWKSMTECCSKDYKIPDDLSIEDPCGGPAPTPNNGVECLDYNGPRSDGRNLNRDSCYQAWINFVGSDCNINMMLGRCWKEYFCDGVKCFDNHGGQNCSPLIKHENDYHAHKNWAAVWRTAMKKK